MKTNEIYNVDAYEAIKVLPDKSVDLIYTDIPYDFEDNGGGGASGGKKRDYHAEYYKICENGSRIARDGLKNAANLKDIAYGIDFAILDEFCRVLKTINIYIWCSKKQLLPLMKYFIDGKNCRFELLTWHKTNPIPTCNGKYLSDTEYCLLFRGAGTKIGGSFETKSKYYISPTNASDKELFAHPTIKPLPFVRNHILNSTDEGDVVLDPFAGSGTTLVAAKELGRRYIGFEINPKWAKIAKDRLNNICSDGQISLFTR